MMLYARSCERPSNSSASVRFPSSVSNSYSFSTETHGSPRRCSATFWPSLECSASSFASSSRAACHSSWLPVLWSGIARLLWLFSHVALRAGRGRWMIASMLRVALALLSVITALAVGASAAAAYSAPELRLRELDVGDQPVGPWLTLDGASLLSANGFELGVVLEKSGEHVLVEVTSVPPGASIADQREVHPTLCFGQTGTPGTVVDLDQRIRYAGNGSYGVRMTVSDARDASTGCTTANAASASGTFAVNARTTVRRIGIRPLVLNTLRAKQKFGGWAIDPPAL